MFVFVSVQPTQMLDVWQLHLQVSKWCTVIALQSLCKVDCMQYIFWLHFEHLNGCMLLCLWLDFSYKKWKSGNLHSSSYFCLRTNRTIFVHSPVKVYRNKTTDWKWCYDAARLIILMLNPKQGPQNLLQTLYM